jgi:uncharacterized protein (TIGR03085 family)
VTGAGGVASRERAALCDLLERLGPDAPTLCEGWTTRHLAAHLVTRDRRPLAVPGMALAPLHPLTERFERRVLEGSDYAELVAQLRAGPPRLSPVGLPGGRELLNVHEYFVHHEDVRRPNGLPRRRLRGELDAALWRRLVLFGPYLARRLVGTGLRIATPDGRTARLLPGRDGIRLEGATGELFMFLYNRRAGARVRAYGSGPAVERLERTRLGP